MVSDQVFFRKSSSALFFTLTNHKASGREKLNGIDLDWEQPTTREEYVAYIHLIIEASVLFHENKLILSIALHPGQYLPRNIYQYVDRVHLMTYDMISVNANEKESYNHHATYEKSKF